MIDAEIGKRMHREGPDRDHGLKPPGLDNHVVAHPLLVCWAAPGHTTTTVRALVLPPL